MHIPRIPNQFNQSNEGKEIITILALIYLKPEYLKQFYDKEDSPAEDEITDAVCCVEVAKYGIKNVLSLTVACYAFYRIINLAFLIYNTHLISLIMYKTCQDLV